MASSRLGRAAIMGARRLPASGQFRRRGRGRKPSRVCLSAWFVASALARRGLAESATVLPAPDWTAPQAGDGASRFAESERGFAERMADAAGELLRAGLVQGGQAGRATQRAARLAALLATGHRLCDGTARVAGYASLRSALSSLVQRGIAAGWLVAPDAGRRGDDCTGYLPHHQFQPRLDSWGWAARQAIGLGHFERRALHERTAARPAAPASLAGLLADAARRADAARQTAEYQRYDSSLRGLRAAQLRARRRHGRSHAAELAKGRADAARACYAVRGWPGRFAR